MVGLRMASRVMLLLPSVLLLALFLSPFVDAMTLLKRRTAGYGSRYFHTEQLLPPLAVSSSSSDTTFRNDTMTIPYSGGSVAKPLPVVYTNDPKQVSQWLCNQLPTSGGGTLGFDVESVPNAPWMKNKASFEGPATVQLATADAALVVHLTRRSGRRSLACTPILEAVLNDATIVKAGTAICDDLLELYDSWKGLRAKSYWDLGHVAGSSQTVGLQRLTRSVLGVELPKSRRVATSDWSQVPLTDTQLSYSARDAWAGAAICAELSRLDPHRFGSTVVTSRLDRQPSVRELFRDRQKRRRAKRKLSQILAPYVRNKSSPRAALRFAHGLPDESKSLPPAVQSRVRDLKDVLNETSRNNVRLVLDVAPLGIEVL